MNNEELERFFVDHKKNNNRKHMSKDSKYGVRKFRKYCNRLK